MPDRPRPSPTPREPAPAAPERAPGPEWPEDGVPAEVWSAHGGTPAGSPHDARSADDWPPEPGPADEWSGPAYGERPASRSPQRDALVAGLVVTALLAVAGWATAAVALTRDGRAAGPRPAPTATAAPAQAAAGPVLAEDPCGPARTIAEARNLSEPHSQRSTTADGTESELRLRLRCVLSAEELSLTAEVLRSGDAGAVRESFEFHRDSADGEARALTGLGREASVATRTLASSGRTTLTVDTRADGVAVSITGTTSGDYDPADAEELLVATARAYLTAR